MGAMRSDSSGRRSAPNGECVLLLSLSPALTGRLCVVNNVARYMLTVYRLQPAWSRRPLRCRHSTLAPPNNRVMTVLQSRQNRDGLLETEKNHLAAIASYAGSLEVGAASAMESSGVELYRYTGMERATLLRRYKRFLGDVQPAEKVEAGQAREQESVAAVETIHVPNTGPMTGLLDVLPAPAVLSRSTAASRKYPCTLEWLRPAPAAPWVGVHSARANTIARALLEKHMLWGLGAYDRVRSEVPYGAGSRVDFVLERNAEEGGSEEDVEGSGKTALSTSLPLYLEVKSVTLAETLPSAALRERYEEEVAAEDDEFESQAKASGASAPHLPPGSFLATLGLFPDTVSLRARKHVEALTRLAAGGGARAALLFLTQREDCQAVAPCFAADPHYASLVSAAARGGVLLLGAAVGLDEREGVVRFVKQVPVLLPRAAAGWVPPARSKQRRRGEPRCLGLDDGEKEGRKKEPRSAADLETFRFRQKT